MAKYVYPAIFKPEENGQFSIRFPDIDGCYTCGDNLADGMEMAQDALSLMLTYLEDEGRDIFGASHINELNLFGNEFATYISCDTAAYRRLMNQTAVTKMVY